MADVKELSVSSETSGGNSIPIQISSISLDIFNCINGTREITCEESDNNSVDEEADNQQSIDMSPDLKENTNNEVQNLFAPFSHHMRPDCELNRLELERSIDQEAATKVINDRYKLIMENAARRKEKEQKDEIKFTQISNNVDPEKLMESYSMGIEDISKVTQSLQNIRLTPDCLARDQLQEFSNDMDDEKMHWNSDLTNDDKIPDKTNDVQNNIYADILSNYILMSVSEDYFLRNMKNEQNDEEKGIEPSSAKCQIIFDDENQFFGSPFDELLHENFEIPCEL